MYETALIVHSAVRWIAFAAVAYAFARGIRGWFADRARAPGDRVAGLVATIAIDVQFTLGLALYVAWSPSVQNALKDMKGAMKDRELRFWAVEHAATMVLVVVLVHVAKVLVKKARTDGRAHKRAAILYGLALAAMIVGTPWPGSSVARPWFRT